VPDAVSELHGTDPSAAPSEEASSELAPASPGGASAVVLESPPASPFAPVDPESAPASTPDGLLELPHATPKSAPATSKDSFIDSVMPVVFSNK
jgi:hypothetical protein